MRTAQCTVGETLLCVALLSVATAVAAAQPAQPDGARADAAPDAEYARLVAAALADFEQGRFERARSWFERAHALWPSARTYWGLGITAFELGRHAQAVQELELALGDERLPLQGAQRAQAHDVIARAARHVGMLRVELEPAAAALAVDGASTSQRELVLAPGSYALSARADGFRAQELRVQLAPGERRSLRIALQPIALRVEPSRARVNAAAPAPPAVDDGGNVLESFWLWTAVAVVVAGGVTAFLVLEDGDDSAPTIHARRQLLTRAP